MVEKRFLRVLIALGASLAFVLATATTAAADPKRIKALDKCEPTSFNAAIGEGTCVGNGRVTFGEFIEELAATRTVATWRFKPDDTRVRSGRDIVVVNKGGEAHTWTEVAAFGPGVVPPLNALTFPELCGPMGTNCMPLPEFAPTNTHNNVFLLPGERERLDTGPGTSLPPGPHLFECAIHPWMQMALHVRPRGHSHD